MKTDMLSDTLKSNIETLREFFYEKSDPRCPGENPACRPLEDAIEDELNTFSDEDLLAFSESLDEKEAEFLFAPLTCLSDTRAVLLPKWA